ncbi:UspA domain protein [Xylanimonas cellulosilytica DSM 15894]|uniref:UspA domain protein n=1 Tax=Xylanimonas cellulosilytica (strain DSM 15894 / JCM 12276 / CECT 5975 / KCTC 9989 / LMG 20990 / NBRC 107835 / XIL07) TaxID=446471 RepID=D1BY94_XYLCX|nr:universal stress protein [Xylanimonas cellulosilytica]ACZ29937.1 UspA domain protein [Xylanimonas cellulosilytica DSM 15894]
MTVLVACNDSPHGEAALRAGIAEAARRRLPLAVLVLNPGDAPPPSLAAQLADLPAGLAAPAVTFRAPDAEPSDAILDAADALHATLVVVGARKRSNQGTFVMGTTTQRVLLDAAAPVLVVKAAYDLPETG